MQLVRFRSSLSFLVIVLDIYTHDRGSCKFVSWRLVVEWLRLAARVPACCNGLSLRRNSAAGARRSGLSADVAELIGLRTLPHSEVAR